MGCSYGFDWITKLFAASRWDTIQLEPRGAKLFKFHNEKELRE